ncbi:MAG: beta-galactosidase [Defluviitaleaceae bacterium]|nr:beta-galactosidase [Defluviitaleaceae bacterium]
MFFGAAYYPEHWPEERWETDAKMMKAAGFTTVRMAEFAWTKMEPQEGQFNFGWLDRAIALLAEHGINTVLGTPTAAPPKWVVDKHPDIFPHDYKGHAKGYGHRRYYCYNNKNFMHYSNAIVTAMAERYGKNPNVIAWQIDNELGCVDTVRCFCENCRRAFHIWLKKRYKDINEVNERWGTVFSNQTYGSFDEIILPTYGPIQLHNPGLALDFRRFSSDSSIMYMDSQIKILSEITQHQKISTNLMNGFTDIDYHKMARRLDLAMMDIYPNHFAPHRPDITAMHFDQIRGVSGQKNYWLVELQSGPPGGDVMRKTPKPGELRRWTFQAIAHGADMALYFRWRTCAFGLEEYWHGILDHHGGENRRYKEVVQTGMDVSKLRGLIENSTSGAKVAIVLCYDSEWVFEIQPHKAGYKLGDHVLDYYNWFYKHNIPVDFISPDDDFSRYNCVVLPNNIICEESTANKLENYVDGGGCVVMDYRAGAKHLDNSMVRLPLPGYLRKLLGITVTEYGVINPSDDMHLVSRKTNISHSYQDWYDVINSETAHVLAQYGNDYFANSPAITVNMYGTGRAYYIGARVDDGMLSEIFEDISINFSLNTTLSVPKGVEAVQRVNETGVFIFVINHNSHNVVIELDAQFVDLLSGRSLKGKTDLEPDGVLVLQRQ